MDLKNFKYNTYESLKWFKKELLQINKMPRTQCTYTVKNDAIVNNFDINNLEDDIFLSNFIENKIESKIYTINSNNEIRSIGITGHINHSVCLFNIVSNAIIIEYVTDAPCIISNHIFLAPNIDVKHIVISQNSLSMRNINVVCSKNSKYDCEYLQYGSGSTHVSYLASLIGENSAVNMNFGIVSDKNAKNILDVHVNHCANNTVSNINHICISNAMSKNYFSCNASIDSDTEKTSSKTKSHSLLMDRNAHAFSMPVLSIFNNDTECAHGATVSYVDESMLHYIMSRGVNRNTAKYVVAKSNVAQVLKDETLRQCIDSQVFK